MIIRTTLAYLMLAIAGGAHAAPRVVEVATQLAPDEAYRIVHGNAVRCWADGEYNITTFEGSEIQPGKVVINGRMGHKFSTVDLLPDAAGTTVRVSMSYLLGRKKREAEWRQALGEWLAGTHTSCPAIP